MKKDVIQICTCLILIILYINLVIIPSNEIFEQNRNYQNVEQLTNDNSKDQRTTPGSSKVELPQIKTLIDPRTDKSIPKADLVYKNHNPILIEDDADFRSYTVSEGWKGDGTTYNPYIIENYLFSDSTIDLIAIKNTSLSFIIRNNFMNGLGTVHNGIYLLGNSGKVMNISNNIIVNMSTDNGITLSNNPNTIIQKNGVKNVGYGIYLDDASSNCICESNIILSSVYDSIGMMNSKNVELINNKISSSQWNGIKVDNSNNSYIKGNFISNCSLNGLKIESNCHLTNVTWNTLSHNQINQLLDNGDQTSVFENFFSDHSLSDGDLDGFTDNSYSVTGSGIIDNHPRSFPILLNENSDLNDFGFPGKGTVESPFLIEDIRLVSHVTTLRIDNVQNVIIQNVRIDNLYAVTPSVRLAGLENVTLTECYISNVGRDGLYLASSIDCILSNNTIKNTLWAGFSIYDVNKSIMNGNTFENCTTRAIYHYDSYWNNISYNNIAHSGDDGIFVISSNNLVIFKNHLNNNGLNGIRVTSGSDNVVSHNTFDSNTQYGIQLDVSSINTNVTWNIFIHSGMNTDASDDGTNNNFSYNFYGTFSSTDSNNDGILDDEFTNFAGLTSNSDNFPRVTPLSFYSNAQLANGAISGSGLITDPYIFEGFNLTYEKEIVHFFNISAPFIFRDNLLNGMNGGSTGITLTNTSNGLFLCNLIENTSTGLVTSYAHGFDVIESSNNIFDNNTIKMAARGFHVFNKCDYNIFRNNKIFDCLQHGIGLEIDSNNNTLMNNHIENVGWRGILFYVECNNNSALNNFIINSTLTGIDVRYSNLSIIRGNTIKNTGLSAINLLNTTQNVVISNFIEKSTSNGFDCINSSDNDIRSNSIQSNAMDGLILINSTNNNIHGNNIYNNTGSGIVINSRSSNNTVNWNVFSNNSVNQATNEGTNTFEYNFWNNWLNNTDIDNDGIFDSSYNHSGVIDLYPRISPISCFSNSQLSSFSAGNGTGLPEDPYIITGFQLLYSNGWIINIQSTTAHFIVQDYILNGSNSNSEGGIYLKDVQNGVIKKIEIYDCQIGIKLENSRSISVESVESSGSTNGIELLNSDNNVINNSKSKNNVNNGILLHSSSDDNIICMNQLTGNINGISIIGEADNNEIINNSCIRNLVGIYLDNIVQSGVNYNTIEKNRIADNEQNGILLNFKVQANTLKSNLLTNNSETAILVYGSDWNIILDNDIISSTVGVNVTDCAETTINGNKIEYCSISGIIINSKANPTIYDENIVDLNFITFCSTSGITIQDSNILTITNNTLQNNFDFGIYLFNSNNSIIEGNEITASGSYGVILNIQSSNNLIYRNGFHNNNGTMSQAYDDGVSNYWYNDIKQEGNLWLDHTSGNYSIDGLSNREDIYSLPLITLNSLNDFSMVLGEVGYLLIWQTQIKYPGNYPENYSIYLNSSAIKFGAMQFGNWSDTIITTSDGFSSGVYNFTIVVFNNFGKKKVDSVFVTVGSDNDPPIVVINPNDLSFPEGSIGYSLTWEATEAQPWKVYIVRNSTEILNSPWNGESIILNLVNLSMGVYIFNCTFEDYSGHRSAGITTVTVTPFLPDTSPPVIIAPDNLTFEYGTSDNYILWNLSDQQPFAYEWFINGSLINYQPWHGENFNQSVDELVIGTWNVTLTIYDLAGNNTSATVFVYVLAAPPDVTYPSINQPINLEIKELTPGMIVWEVDDENPSFYQIYQNSSIVREGDWSSGTISYAFSSLPIGDWEFKLTIWDIANHSSSSVVYIKVGTGTIVDETPPQISNPNDISIEFGEKGEVIVFHVFDEHPKEIKVKMNETEIYSSLWFNVNQKVEISLDNLAVGTYIYTLTACDQLDNYSNRSVTVIVVGDTEPPKITPQADSITLPVGSTEKIWWVIEDEHLDKYAIIILNNNTVVETDILTSNNIKIEFSIENFESGEYTIRLVVYDMYGHNSQSDINIKVTTAKTSPGFDLSMVQLIIVLLLIPHIWKKKRRNTK